jgi:hypothetical protein
MADGRHSFFIHPSKSIGRLSLPHFLPKKRALCTVQDKNKIQKKVDRLIRCGCVVLERGRGSEIVHDVSGGVVYGSHYDHVEVQGSRTTFSHCVGVAEGPWRVFKQGVRFLIRQSSIVPLSLCLVFFSPTHPQVATSMVSVRGFG